MLTHWQSVRYAGISALGVISVLGALAAMLYTSAATALVQPQLKYPKWQPKVMQGLVKSSFSNPDYIQSACKTPILPGYDPDFYSSTCIQLEHAAMGYHNYYGYLGIWADVIHNGTGSSDLNERPKGFALLNDNTTVTAPWVEQNNVTIDEKTGALINNVSMAMPHPGVIQAAMDEKNSLMQPSELDGLGSYNIRASVPSGVVHVLCATMSTAQLKPFVYELWDGAQLPVNVTNWQHNLAYVDPFLNGTDFDHIFNWGAQYGINKWPPIFSKLPIDYNTMLNDTQGIPWGRDSVYLLGKGGDSDSVGNAINDTNYALCQMKVSQTPFCSTQYNASASGGTLEAVCDPNEQISSTDSVQYIHSLPVATSGNFSVSQDWPNIASEWGRSLSLNDGVFDGNGSNARLLTQLILTNTSTKLDPALPSIAEALAVMSGCTLLQASTDAPFVEFWNYTLTTMSPGQYQVFNASVRAQQYTSGGSGQAYQKAFYVVLATVFGMNVIVLAYFAVHRDWYTDFSEPSTLFSLAVNSPPSKEMAGSCGGGPKGEHFNVNWKLNQDGEHVYMESWEKDEPAEGSPGLKRRFNERVDLVLSPMRKVTSTFDLRRSRQ
ncbi:hypothetical protein LTR08_002320 [Meristemomyces frigidus]|nr:hypothetical protein LTR08_002320 [Meristemomyces frigidus]